MHPSSYIEINRSALKNNIDFIKKRIGPDVQFSSVIKGNAYGHGIEEFGPIAQGSGVNHFSVFSADEAFRLFEALPAPATIMVMGYIDNSELEWVIKNEIEFFVFELDRLESAISIAKRIKKPAKIHLELETGMYRSGFDGATLSQAVSMLQAQQENVQLQGVCTHYAGAENLHNHERVMAQYTSFNQQVKELENKHLKPKLKHTACSAATMAYPKTQMDMVRIGIMQYGFWPSPETYGQYIAQNENMQDPLHRLITWKSHIMSLKHVPEGAYVGYGTSYQASQDMIMAVIPVGYAWGYSRSLSNQGQVLIRGHYAGVVGIVNMNVMMVDVTNIAGVRKDDEVVLLGTQGDKSITVASFGERSTQLNYELLTRLPVNIPRNIVD
ncbi:alanine racemase [Pontibacter silvestris]|uniref:Alanine racemase n=1 Tax=Pontibacter silvestris TaxID=2305183 RepID=A0ABW4WWV4_9BACT|nr:alanine racemase [Pontibacter silvestris]MCC9137362.1 alanine racemase [Pontibacter silvestris]